jgi:beta-galactosidase
MNNRMLFATAALLAGCAVRGQSTSAPRQILPFDEGWRFARFGTMPDGSRRDEPGGARRSILLTASSEEGAKGNIAQAAMDGDPNTRWCATGPEPGQWLQLDLGKQHEIGDIKILWETGDHYAYVVEGSGDGKNWHPLPGQTRHIRIRAIETPVGKWASIREIELTDRAGNRIENRLLPPTLAPQNPKYDDRAWRTLDLPHDWAIEGPFRYDLEGHTGKLPWRGIGWYRKHFSVPAKDKGKTVFVDFDGAMANAEVFLNGHKVGGRPYGYASFRVDLTPRLKFGKENLLAVRLDTQKWDSRWYPGAGIYRHVRLVTVNPVHVAHWGVFVTTPEITDAAGKAKLSVTLDNRSGKATKATVRTTIHPLLRNGKSGNEVGRTEDAKVTIVSGGTAQTSLEATVKKPKRWDVDSPERYVARTSVIANGKVVDLVDTPFGFRTIAFTHDDGFHLNGRRVQINGVCQHHDLGALGAAVNKRAIERQLEILRSFGCNAIRTSHNPPAPELLEACDRLGFLVMDEAFDCWTRGKRPSDYAKLYNEWHDKDLEMLVKRDRNHLCIILWSTGNEVDEQYNPELGITRHLTEVVHRFDTTRPVTFGASWPAKSAMNGTELQVDVHGMNYAAGGYGGPDFYGEFLNKPGHEKLSGFSSESASTVSSRGEYPPCTPWQVSSYDLEQPGWGALPDEEFAALDKYPAICGEFVWTGFDYLGEPTPFNSDATNLLNLHGDDKKLKEMEAELERINKSRPPSRSSYFGIVDLAGFPKDRYYLYQSRWRPDFPMAHILPHWNWPERVGKATPVFVYTSGDEAELFLNGKSLGRRKKGRFEYRLRWNEVKYEPGELEAVAYKNGKEWATDVVKTTGPAAKLGLTADRKTIDADGIDLAFITVRIEDGDGLVVPRSHNFVQFSIEGPGEIVATDNGDATSFEPFGSPKRKAFNGLALVIVRAKKGGHGAVVVKASSDGLVGARISLRAK